MDQRHQINQRADAGYSDEGAGVGAGGEGVLRLKEFFQHDVPTSSNVLEIGFGKAELIRYLDSYLDPDRFILGYDICPACFKSGETVVDFESIQQEHIDPDSRTFIDLTPVYKLKDRKYSEFIFEDVSHSVSKPEYKDEFDYAFCTETIEHLSNPYNMVSMVKDYLKDGGYFCLAFPMPEDNLGYGGGQHAHVYPGFLTKDSFETFMRQMYFIKVGRATNGSSAWYLYRNYKGDGMVDVFRMIAGNYTEDQLYGFIKEQERE